MKTLLSAALAAVLLIAASPSFAAGGGSGGSNGSTWSGSDAKDNANFAAGRTAVESKDFAKAIPLLEKVVASDPNNADAFNLLGYSRRNAGDLDGAFAAYERALTLDPKHKGAHEYVGEAYLQAGNLAKAEEHLAALDKICFFGCDEYDELKDRIAAFKAKK